MDYIQELLGLPVEVLFVLAAGYLSYRLAYTGKDATHKTIDVIFLVFVYAFVARLVAGLVGAALSDTGLSAPYVQICAGLIGMFLTLCVAAYWRKWGKLLVFELLRYLKISCADRHVFRPEGIPIPSRS